MPDFIFYDKQIKTNELEKGGAVMKKIIMMPVIIVSLVFLVSCKTTQTPIGGAVVTQPVVYGVGSYAPDIKFVDMKGRLHHLASFYRDANIIHKRIL